MHNAKNTELKEKVDNSTVIIENCIIPISVMDRQLDRRSTKNGRLRQHYKARGSNRQKILGENIS